MPHDAAALRVHDVELVAPSVLRRQHDPPRCRSVGTAAEQMERLEGRRLSAPQQAPRVARPSSPGFVEQEVDAGLAGREMAEADRGVGGIARRQDARSEVEPPAHREALRDLRCAGRRGHRRVVAPPQAAEPRFVGFGERDAEHDPERGLEILGAVPVVEQVEHLVVAEAVGEVHEERLSLLVHQHRAGDRVAARERQGLACEHGVAQQAFGVRIPLRGVELSQTFREPQRGKIILRAAVLAHHARELLEHVGVRELVPRHPFEAGARSGVRDQHAALDQLGQTARAL